jgi:hypothetical protein
MAIQSTSSSSFAATASTEVPASANFIGSAEDALVFQSLVLNATTDRLRESIVRNLGSASSAIEKVEVLSSTLARLSTFTQANQVPVTYSALQSAEKTTASLRLLFAKDGPNLGESLEKSQAVLNELATSGVTLVAPKQTPVMTEQFAAVGGKVDFLKSPSSASVDWRTDQEVATIDPGSVPGSLPGTFVKMIESRDSTGKLISVTRYTVFVDYANLRPVKADLDKEFLSYIEKVRSTLDDLVLRLAETFRTERDLNQRENQEYIQITDEQTMFFKKEQEKNATLVEARRLFRIFYLEVNNLKVQFDQKVEAKSVLDSTNNFNNGVNDSNIGVNDSNIGVNDSNIGKKKFFLAKTTDKFESSNSTKSISFDDAGFLDFKDDISSLKSLINSLSKAVDSISKSLPDNV